MAGFYFRWFPATQLRDRIRIQFAKSHRPEICIPAAGISMRRDAGFSQVMVGDLALPFRDYVFEDRGRPLRVFYCVWEDGTRGSAPANMRENSTARLRAALTGNRTIGQRVFELAVWGIADEAEARAALLQQIQKLVRI